MTSAKVWDFWTLAPFVNITLTQPIVCTCRPGPDKSRVPLKLDVLFQFERRAEQLVAEQEEVLPPEEGGQRRHATSGTEDGAAGEAADGGAEAAPRPRREPQGQAGHDAHQEAVPRRRQARQEQDGLPPARAPPKVRPNRPPWPDHTHYG